MKRVRRRLSDESADSVIGWLSADDIQALSREASRHGRSACGRPEWLARNSADVRAAVIRIFGRESDGVVRCVVTLLVGSGAPRWFTVDVADDRLRTLPILDCHELAILVGLLLEHAEHVPVEE